jgi:hypothetical protein
MLGFAVMSDAARPTNPFEQDDVRELIRTLHADRQAAKDKERRESWTRYVSLMIVALAVATAIASLKSGGFGSKVMLNQSQASDTWAFYQAKTIKQRYRHEEAELQSQARSLEAARDEAARHGPPLGFAIASLQISIALASVCLITKRRPLWLAAGILGSVGLAYLGYGLWGV